MRSDARNAYAKIREENRRTGNDMRQDDMGELDPTMRRVIDIVGTIHGMGLEMANELGPPSLNQTVEVIIPETENEEEKEENDIFIGIFIIEDC
ncbi:hypothetical protein TKK_0017483 [Trichogramma kaykai]